MWESCSFRPFGLRWDPKAPTIHLFALPDQIVVHTSDACIHAHVCMVKCYNIGSCTSVPTTEGPFTNHFIDSQLLD
jgi:hypothetical protein